MYIYEIQDNQGNPQTVYFARTYESYLSYIMADAEEKADWEANKDDDDTMTWEEHVLWCQHHAEFVRQYTDWEDLGDEYFDTLYYENFFKKGNPSIGVVFCDPDSKDAFLQNEKNVELKKKMELNIQESVKLLTYYFRECSPEGKNFHDLDAEMDALVRHIIDAAIASATIT